MSGSQLSEAGRALQEVNSLHYSANVSSSNPALKPDNQMRKYSELHHSSHNSGKPLRNFESAAVTTSTHRLKESAVMHKSESLKHSMLSQERQPLICLDIKISLEKTEQLMIFENDNVEEVTEAFAREHALPEHKKLKLLAILKKQVESMEKAKTPVEQQYVKTD